METIRLSVRQMVEFSIRGEDLDFTPPAFAAMSDGALAHRSRQQAYTQGWEKEVSLALTLKRQEAVFIISGRMDGFFDDAACPVVDEIKLYQKGPLPQEPAPAHLAQGLCYGHILCSLNHYPKIQVQVSYVDPQGNILVQFSDTYTSQFLKQHFDALFEAVAAWEEERIRHQKKRDESILSLTFPFTEYRLGQREMSVQVYTAIKQKKRLFASLPTGTGKSAAVLFPAIKALAQGLTKQLFYLTARNTGKESPLKVLSLLHTQPFTFRSLVLTAREKACIHTQPLACFDCPYAQGFFTRLPQALEAFFTLFIWSEEVVQNLCTKHQICPFECALILSEVADLVICDYNYAFDPSVQLQRIFERRTALTLLVDEAHHLPDRARDMLSALLDGKEFRHFRKEVGKALGRGHLLYKQLTALLNLLQQMEEERDRETFLQATLLPQAELLFEAAQLVEAPHQQALNPLFSDMMRQIYRFIKAAQGSLENFCLLYEKKGKESSLTLFATDVREHLAAITQKLRGSIYFSATLSPLMPMGKLLGAQEEDGYFALPSPFPKEHLLVLRKNIDTRYRARSETAEAVAKTILETFLAHPGKYIAYFSSFAYLNLIYQQLLKLEPNLPYLQQSTAMNEEAREEFINAFLQNSGPLLGLCVLGGIFAEGIDLPGSALIGTMIVGVGLPMVTIKQEALRKSLGAHLGNGFAYAYQYPGMQKVLQAAGRVIRSEEDYGVVILIDSRYFQQDYLRLCPEHWLFENKSLTDFWKTKPAHLP